MANNDQIILGQVLEQERAQRAPNISTADFFEMFVAEQVLKDFDLSDDEIELGLVGAGGDGGIDGLYVFANGELMQEDSDVSTLRRNIELEVVVIQSKTTAGFDEDTLNRFAASTKDLFDLTKPLQSLKNVYNERILAAVTLFRRIYKELAAKFPSLRFNYVFATRGDSRDVHPNVSRKVELIRHTLGDLFSSANFSFEFLGASDLLKLARRKPASSYYMAVAESISAQGGYIALVRLSEFNKFISDQNGNLRKNLFDANVRDYQGSTQVNEEIQKSLSKRGPEDFWWLNNGVTIIAGKAVQSGKTLTMEDPQIVNGFKRPVRFINFSKLPGMPTMIAVSWCASWLPNSLRVATELSRRPIVKQPSRLHLCALRTKFIET